MRVDVGPLFEPLPVGGKLLRNRIVMPPMVVLRGLTTADGVAWYGTRARGGVALVIVEATPVNRFGNELTAANLRPLVEAIHEGGALAAIQLFPVTRGRRVEPADLSAGEIAAMLDDYRRAAEVCVAAGFDGVEPHGAHGFLLNQFFSPLQNRRQDGYGGSPENRMRLALEVTAATRRAAGADCLLLYRHTPVGQGYGIDESLVLAEALVAAGVDILDISPSSVDAPGDRAAPFTRFGVPVIAVNELDDVGRALTALNEGRAQLVAVGRGLIADPEWPLKVRQGRFTEIVKCARCNTKCYGNLNQGLPVECARWR